jgi:hypothetical protein
MLSSNLLGLLRPFLEMEGIPEIDHHTAGDSSTTYDGPELEFLGLIREHGLEIFLPVLIGEPQYHVIYRRSVLCRAFNVFLRRGDHHQFPEFLNIRWDVLPSGIEGSDYDTFWRG